MANFKAMGARMAQLLEAQRTGTNPEALPEVAQKHIASYRKLFDAILGMFEAKLLEQNGLPRPLKLDGAVLKQLSESCGIVYYMLSNLFSQEDSKLRMVWTPLAAANAVLPGDSLLQHLSFTQQKQLKLCLGAVHTEVQDELRAEGMELAIRWCHDGAGICSWWEICLQEASVGPKNLPVPTKTPPMPKVIAPRSKQEQQYPPQYFTGKASFAQFKTCVARLQDEDSRGKLYVLCYKEGEFVMSGCTGCATEHILGLNYDALLLEEPAASLYIVDFGGENGEAWKAVYHIHEQTLSIVQEVEA